MNNVRKNLEYFIQKRGINPTILAQETRIPQPTIHRILSGESKDPRTDTLRPLADYFQCTVEFLRSADAEHSDAASDSYVSCTDPYFGSDAAGSKLEQCAAPSDMDYAEILQYDAKGACGAGYLNGHVAIKGSLAFKRDWLSRLGLREQDLSVIYAHGESMAPTLTAGEVLLVDHSQTEPRDGKIFAIQRDGEILIKRLVRSWSGDWIIRSDNADKAQWPDMPVHADMISQVEIIGRVVWRGGGV